MDKKVHSTAEILANLKLAGGRVQSLESIKNVMLNIVEQSDPKDALQAICAAGRKLCKARYVFVQVLDRSGKYLRIGSQVGLTEKEAKLRLQVGKEGITGRCIREGATQNVPDVSTDKDFIRCLPGVKSALAIPLFSHNKLIGAFNLESTKAAAFSGAREEDAETLARLAVVCIDRAIAHDQESKQHQILEALHAVDSCLLNPAATLDDALRVILEKAMEISQADCGFVQIVDSDTNEMVIRVVSGGQIELDKRRYKIGQEGITGRVAKTLKSENLADVTKDSTYIPFFKKVRSELTIPLVYEKTLRGVLDVNSRTPGWFTQQDLDYLSYLSSQAVVAVVLAQHRNRVRQLASLDAVEDTAASAVHYLKNQASALDLGLGQVKKALSLERLSTESRSAIDEELKKLSDNVARMDRLCQQIFQPSRRVIRRIQFDLREFVISQVKLAEIDRLVPCEIVGPEETIKLLSDPDVLSEVVQNLLKNAREALEDRSNPRITLSYGYSPLINGAVFVTIADNGRGMSQKDIGKIFSPFASRKRHGAGIGLAISHGLLKRLGGTIEVSSEPGQGSQFTLTIPVKKELRDGAST